MSAGAAGTPFDGGQPVSDPGREALAWAARAPDVSPKWFMRTSTLHGIHHTQRVHIHAQRLAAEHDWSDADTRLVLQAALWHDIGRTDDDVDPGHGAASALRAARLGLPAELPESDAGIVLFAVRFHSLSDEEAVQTARSSAGNRDPAWPRAGARMQAPEDPERALDILWLLKDADALDRVRLARWEAADPKQLRLPGSVRLLPFASELYEVVRA